MAFQLAKFLAHISPAALQAHLHATLPELAATIDWSIDAKALPAHVASVMLESPMEASARARIDFERMEILARSPGDQAMVAACNHRNDLADSLKSLPNSQERALWLFGQDPTTFRRAEETRHADHHAEGRQWTGFLGPRGVRPSTDVARLASFKERIATCFRKFDGSGASIDVVTYERGPTSRGRHAEGPVFQVVAYLEGLPASFREFVEGVFQHRPMRPANEVVLTLALETGAIDVIAKAGKEHRTAFAKAYVEELLPANADATPVRLRQYDFQRLARAMSFPTAPEEGIKDVRLKMLPLAGQSGLRQITLEVEARGRCTRRCATSSATAILFGRPPRSPEPPSRSVLIAGQASGLAVP